MIYDISWYHVCEPQKILYGGFSQRGYRNSWIEKTPKTFGGPPDLGNLHVWNDQTICFLPQKHADNPQHKWGLNWDLNESSVSPAKAMSKRPSQLLELTHTHSISERNHPWIAGKFGGSKHVAWEITHWWCYHPFIMGSPSQLGNLDVLSAKVSSNYLAAKIYVIFNKPRVSVQPFHLEVSGHDSGCQNLPCQDFRWK